MVRSQLSLAAFSLTALLSSQTHPNLSSGPMPTYAEMTETAIWVQTKKPGRVQVRFRPIERLEYPTGGGQRWTPVVNAAWQRSEVLRTTKEGDTIALAKLTDLPRGTRFEYTVAIDGRDVAFERLPRFQTQPHWRFTAAGSVPPEFTFLIGSCSYVNEAATDRPGTPYGAEHEIYRAMAKENADFMVWLGDNLYYREMDWLTEDAMRRRWRYDRAFPLWQPFLMNTHHYATWDDHDFGPNDSDRSFRLRDEALEVFNDYFPSLQRGTSDAKGTFFRFEWGDVEFFMLDDRYHRAPNNTPAGDPKPYYGPAQVQWLKDSLLDSNATFKIIVGGGQMLNPLNVFEMWGRFPAEQKEFLDWLARSGVNGVTFLSGDRHATELLRVQWPGAPYAWTEYTSSPLTSSPRSAIGNEATNPARVPDTWIGKRNYGKIQVVGPNRGRRLILTAHDKDGKELWRHEIAASDLRPKS